MKYRKTNKAEIFLLMCKIDADIMNPGFPISIPNIASLLRTSKYQVQKYMNILREAGLVKAECMYYDGNPSYETGELFDDPRIIRGWNLTSKARETEMYKTTSKTINNWIFENTKHREK